MPPAAIPAAGSPACDGRPSEILCVSATSYERWSPGLNLYSSLTPCAGTGAAGPDGAGMAGSSALGPGSGAFTTGGIAVAVGSCAAAGGAEVLAAGGAGARTGVVTPGSEVSAGPATGLAVWRPQPAVIRRAAAST